jgi:predicted DNA-binding transcriptional regulator AlpA
MRVETISRARFQGASTAVEIRQPANPERLLTTGQVATHTGMSESWICKGRIYGWGPKYLRLGAGGKSGAIRYRWSDILAYLQECECNPAEVG